MIAGKESHDCFGISPHDLNQRGDDPNRGAPVHGLCNDE